MRIHRYIHFNLVLILFISVVFLAPQTEAQTSNEIEKPEKHFGYKPGTDRELFDYEELIGYLHKLDVSSPRLKLVEIGKSPMGKKMYIAFLSSEENISNLDNLKIINRRLALDPNISESEREPLLNEGKVFFLATLSMHADEVGPSQSAPLIAYDLVTTNDPQKEEWLDNVVCMMVPCHNPDGMDMVVDHYRKYLGTKYEGSTMPGVYHKYIGHDNNRDFLNLSQMDNKAIARIYSKEWFPQVMVEKHQMGSRGIRYFVPPVHDPIAENIDAGLYNWTGIIGSNLMTDMTKQGLAGVAHHYLFDDYAPLYTEICTWKNVISFLTEAASVKDATPIFIEANELGAYGKGLSEYKKSINMPLPWPGGWWKLSDIIEYEITSTMSILKTVSVFRRNILEFQLPVRDISKMLKASGLFCPGSLVKILLKNNHPITFGMPKETGILFEGGPVFFTSIPDFDMDRRVIGIFPEKNILLSGYCEKEEELGNRTALVWLKKGQGQLVLFGFNPVFRASTQVSFKLLFNSILLPAIQKEL